MLILTRNLNQAVVVASSIKIVVLGVRGHSVRLGFQAPREIPIYREEICDNRNVFQLVSGDTRYCADIEYNHK